MYYYILFSLMIVTFSSLSSHIEERNFVAAGTLENIGLWVAL